MATEPISLTLGIIALLLLSAQDPQINVGQIGDEKNQQESVASVPPIAGDQKSAAFVDQLSGDDAPKSSDVDQLPDTLEPINKGDEDALAQGSQPTGDLTQQVIAAWNLIRDRGQTPTPDLIASEIGADKVAEFLAMGGGAARVLATGQLPDTGTQPDVPKGPIQIITPNPDG